MLSCPHSEAPPRPRSRPGPSPVKAWAPGTLKVRTGRDTGTDKGRFIREGLLCGHRLITHSLYSHCVHIVPLKPWGFFPTIPPSELTLQRRFPVELCQLPGRSSGDPASDRASEPASCHPLSSSFGSSAPVVTAAAATTAAITILAC